MDSMLDSISLNTGFLIVPSTASIGSSVVCLHNHESPMPEFRFSLKRIFSYKNKIKDFVLKRENTYFREKLYSDIFYAV